MRLLVRVFIRFLVITVIEALSLLLTAALLPGISMSAVEGVNVLTAAVSVALVLALLNSLVRPLLILITLPINIYTVGLFTLIINASMIWLASLLLPYFEVEGFWAAVGGALVLAAVNTLLTSLTTIDDHYAFYDGAVQWFSRRRLQQRYTVSGRGLVLLEIDGLSYQRVQAALQKGLMPTMQKLLDQGSHRLSHVDCGVPSQTSSCQAGIMYGDNYNIPSFRWYDKEQARLYVSNNFTDAAEIDARFANGNGLLRGGTSINNLMSGEAENALMTMSRMRSVSESVEAPADLYLVFVNPYFLSRAIILTLWDIIVELLQALRQRLRNIRPRINRLERAYPLLRGFTNVFLRDLSTYTVMLDIMRGSPAIYATFLGYDEIAHHAGPDTADALNSLKSFDRQLNRILDVIDRKASRPYDVFLLSDHGQSAGATFRQRYGITLRQLLRQLTVRDTKVTEVDATEDARGQAVALLSELRTMQQTTTVSRATRSVIERAGRSLEKRVGTEPEPVSVPMDTDVLACVSGNLANVYFPLRTGKVTISELAEAHPGLVEALVEHPGIGLVIGYESENEPWALGKRGARNLHDSTKAGTDPLEPYGDPELRARQLARLAAFPHAGDLILISTVYEEGEVAAFEELVGSHGGLGGQQTDAFLFHPTDMVVPPTSNATDLYALLNARRGLEGKPLRPTRPTSEPGDWSWRTLRAGLQPGSTFFYRIARVFQLDRAVFEEVAADPRATGQAVLIVLVLTLISAVAAVMSSEPGPASPPLLFLADVAGSLFGYALLILGAIFGGHILRGRGTFTVVFRTLMFAQVPELISTFSFIPFLGPLLQLTSFLLRLFTTWMALQEALRVSRWRALFIPIVTTVVVALGVAIIIVISSGVGLTVETVLSYFGV